MTLPYRSPRTRAVGHANESTHHHEAVALEPLNVGHLAHGQLRGKACVAMAIRRGALHAAVAFPGKGLVGHRVTTTPGGWA